MGTEACSACSFMLRLRGLLPRSPACESLSRLDLAPVAMLRRLLMPREAISAKSSDAAFSGPGAQGEPCRCRPCRHIDLGSAHRGCGVAEFP